MIVIVLVFLVSLASVLRSKHRRREQPLVPPVLVNLDWQMLRNLFDL